MVLNAKMVLPTQDHSNLLWPWVPSALSQPSPFFEWSVFFFSLSRLLVPKLSAMHELIHYSKCPSYPLSQQPAVALSRISLDRWFRHQSHFWVRCYLVFTNMAMVPKFSARILFIHPESILPTQDLSSLFWPWIESTLIYTLVTSPF